MLTKQEIIKRIGELEAQADAAAQNERRRQAAERRQLQSDCDAAGGHFYAHYKGNTYGDRCEICGYDKRNPVNTVGSNVLKG